MKPFIELKNVKFQYSSKKEDLVLDNINLNIKKGEFVAILGHNGSGKSTLAKHLNAILLPSEGTVFVDGMDTADEKNLFKLRQIVGMVFQNPDNQIVATIVEEDVAFAPENLGIPQPEIRKRVDYSLKAVGMSNYKDAQPHHLSGGQKQRIAIAGIIAMMPKCIVLDEPTAMLDPSGRREVIKTIKELNVEEKITIVLITHYMDEAILADRIVVMDQGSIILDDIPAKVFEEVELLKSVGLDVPQTTELMHRLRLAGVNTPKGVLSEKQCAEALMSILGDTK